MTLKRKRNDDDVLNREPEIVQVPGLYNFETFRIPKKNTPTTTLLTLQPLGEQREEVSRPFALTYTQEKASTLILTGAKKKTVIVGSALLCAFSPDLFVDRNTVSCVVLPTANGLGGVMPSNYTVRTLDGDKLELVSVLRFGADSCSTTRSFISGTYKQLLPTIKIVNTVFQLNSPVSIERAVWTKEEADLRAHANKRLPKLHNEIWSVGVANLLRTSTKNLHAEEYRLLSALKTSGHKMFQYIEDFRHLILTRQSPTLFLDLYLKVVGLLPVGGGKMNERTTIGSVASFFDDFLSSTTEYYASDEAPPKTLPSRLILHRGKSFMASNRTTRRLTIVNKIGAASTYTQGVLREKQGNGWKIFFLERNDWIMPVENSEITLGEMLIANAITLGLTIPQDTIEKKKIFGFVISSYLLKHLIYSDV